MPENVALMERDAKLAMTLKHGRKEGLTGCISREALMNAVRTEGTAVLGSDARGYWDDMKRRYPHLNLSGRAAPTGDSLNGHTCRLGKVSERWTARTGWTHWEGGRWVPGKRGGEKAEG